MKRILTILIIATLTLASSAMSSQLTKTAACKSLQRSCTESNHASVPAAFWTAINAYKEDWSRFCTGTNNNLSALWEKGLDLEKSGKVVTDSELDESVLNTLETTIKECVPAFEASLYGEYVYFKPAPEKFADIAPFGNDDDKKFWPLYSEIEEPTLPPWINQVWDYGGCSKYGEYDWIAEIDKLTDLQRTLKQPSYKKMALGLEKKLMNKFNADAVGESLCTCDEHSFVLKDLNKINSHLLSVESLKGYSPAVKDLMHKIENGTITIRSYKSGECTGG